MKRVGIYAGTFDPIHNGHLAFANTALKEAGLDKVFFLVEPSPRRKQGVRAFEHRMQMARLATKGHKQLGDIILEQTRFSVPDTLPILQERFRGSELYMLLGEDVLEHLISWPQVDHLLSSVNFVIGVRENAKNAISETIKTIEQTRGLRLNHLVVTGDFSNVSSSKIRQSLRRGTQPALISPEVLDYINEHGLYTSAKAE